MLYRCYVKTRDGEHQLVDASPYYIDALYKIGCFLGAAAYNLEVRSGVNGYGDYVTFVKAPNNPDDEGIIVWGHRPIPEYR